MKYIISTVIILFFSNITLACEFFDKNTSNVSNMLMGKKSKFYDAYKQGKCVLEEALSPLPEEQKKVIANLIAKTYKLEN